MYRVALCATAAVALGACSLGSGSLSSGYNEPDIPGLLERAKESGASRAFMSMLHLDTDSIEDD